MCLIGLFVLGGLVASNRLAEKPARHAARNKEDRLELGIPVPLDFLKTQDGFAGLSTQMNSDK